LTRALRAPRLVIAGTASGVGKTTVTLALARAFRARGLRVAVFKCGPDYLDPTYHARAVQAPCQNLDGWMMGRDAVRATFAAGAVNADVSLIEGVMGLYDGASATSEAGSTAEIAKWLDAPVVLVADASGIARSLGAVALGFVEFDRDTKLSGIVANRVGSRGHLDLLRSSMARPAVFGGLPRDPEHAFADRHLGLHTADERILPESVMDHWGKTAEEWLDGSRLLALAETAPELSPDVAPGLAKDAPRRCRIGVARDQAFHFYYADNLRHLERLGAELVEFSPLRDSTLPDVHGLYLGGGYPELHAAALSENDAMRGAVRAFAASGGPVYAECGGFMYLTRAIRTLGGEAHEMVGLFDTEVRMCTKLQALGYVEVETTAETILGPAGTRFRGHQFRYSELADTGTAGHVYTLRGRRGRATTSEGYRFRNVVASYVHAHWASNPTVASSFVESCAARANGGGS
jgi:cobyrinic acid a,c-diamide synthase